MSVSPFKDTITLWHCISSESGQTYIRRVIKRVKCTVTEKNSGKDTAVLFIPLYGKRDIRYMTSDEFGTGSGHGDEFTVKVGDRLVCGISYASAPPDGSITVSSVTGRTAGSRRMRHLEIHGEKTTSKGEEE